MSEFKLLDPHRKVVLALPPSPFKLWVAYWMFESDDQEAYPSLDKLEEVTQMSRNTLLTARKHLLDTGWLVKLTGTAAERYSKPTNGAWKIAIYRVDDPARGAKNEPLLGDKGGEIPLLEGGVQKMNPPKIPPKVLYSGSSYGSFSASASAYGYDSEFPAVVREGGDASHLNATTKATTTPTPKPKTPARSVPVKLKHNPKYTEPFPLEFDSWPVDQRAVWCEKYRVGSQAKATVPTPKDSAPVIAPVVEATATPVAPPPDTPRPPTCEPYTMPKTNKCAECDATFPTSLKGIAALGTHFKEAHKDQYPCG